MNLGKTLRRGTRLLHTSQKIWRLLEERLDDSWVSANLKHRNVPSEVKSSGMRPTCVNLDIPGMNDATSYVCS